VSEQGTIVLTGGGTGGHVMPALAVAQAIQACSPQTAIHYVGGNNSMEEELVRERGLPFHGLTVHPFFGKPAATRLKAICAIPPALYRAAAILKKVKAVATMAFGGYVSAAVGLVAPVLGIPLIIQEQNSIPGRTNRLLSKRASMVCLGFPDAKAYLQNPEMIITGNPVRAEIERVGQLASPPFSPLRLLVMGGSQGALFLNQNAPNAVQKLQEKLGEVHVHHQCGRHDADTIKAAYAQHNIQAHVEPFIKDMAAAYEGTHLALARSGALSVSELWCSATPSVFVPFPYATDDHQHHNAQNMASTGAARVLRQENATEGDLAAALYSLVESETQYQEHRTALRDSARNQSAEQIARETLRIAGIQTGGLT